jgi:GNAT superfamily N-acetyltransferase
MVCGHRDRRQEHTMTTTLPATQLGWHVPVPPARTCIISSEITPVDRQALLDLFTRSSPETRRNRFHSALSLFPQRYLDEILTGRQLAVVARDTCHDENQGKVFGLAPAAQLTPGVAEFAVWVDDAWQGHGVGTLLARAILHLLAEQGARCAIGIIEPGNVAVRRMVHRVAPGAATRYDEGMIVVSIPLANWGAAPDAGS